MQYIKESKMKWAIYKENCEDLGFALACLDYQAITIEELKKWLDIVLMDTPTEELPNYFFNLVDADQGHFANDIGYTPGSNLSRYEKYALEGIAYIRKVRSLTDMVVKEETALKALQNNPHILERFKKFFPFVEI